MVAKAKQLTVALADIDVSDRLLPLDETAAREVAVSMAAHEVTLHPIGLRQTPRGAKKWALVHGRHRLRAFEINGLTALVEGVHFTRLGMDAEQARLVEIEENMARADRSPFARAVMVAAYRDATGLDGRGGHRKRAKEINQERLDTLREGFVGHAMAAFDLSSDQVERLLRIGTALTKPEGLAERLHFSRIARNQSQLLKLAALPDEQLARAAEAFDAAKGDFFNLMAILNRSPEDQAQALGKLSLGATLDDVVGSAKIEQSPAHDFWKQAVSSYSQLDFKGRVTATVEHFKHDEKAVREALKALGYALVKVTP